ncbi:MULTISPECIES: Bug family tripartite tricarboxylate transporter substrate binding protein [Ramlibacter]|uniref:Tripartite tricarboxylate transporter substrate binding protein n=1 Tax=Ramlibacter pinisoli TaxID=2682844 RepID=A0A6N8IQS5_9BURK|nr:MULTISPECIES: tripartite tricarboxylate transporter substrate binding protein [Ramlibacter]MBA2964293.1 tripartite tricarboxylate transporter substrate binding protein [Ramlibacter sp. CGMCC 1.13660]MVQ29259.1 tripartite tricarboxylate transporter substrate binding protein [Ramlibacter pinisoli]
MPTTSPARRAALRACAMAALALASGAASAQAWPSKPVTIVVPFAPGGGTDIGTRVVAQKLSQLWGQSVVVDNRGGAGGNVGLDIVARAKPDGYTLMTGNVGTQSINPTLYKKLSYNPDTAFTPIAQFAELPFVLAATTSLPAKNARELVALAKAQPDKVSYASSGSGGSPHLSGETFKIATGTKILHVPYKGGGAAMTDLIAGNVQLMFASVLELSGHIKAGKLKALAIAGKQRVAALPDVPTLEESGVTGAESGSWLGLLAPAGTPQAVVDKVAQDVRQVLAMPDVQQQLQAQGAVARFGTAAEFNALIASDRKRYARIITENNLSAD